MNLSSMSWIFADNFGSSFLNEIISELSKLIRLTTSFLGVLASRLDKLESGSFADSSRLQKIKSN